jgi:hypothetical protein
METYHQTKPNGLRWLFALGAAAGTFLLVFVPGGWWLKSAQQPDEILTAILLKQLLTVMLLLIVPSLWARLAHRTSPWVLVLLTGFAFGCGLLLSNDWTAALYAALLAALPGAGLYALQRLKLSNFRTVLYEAFLILAALFGYACLPDLIKSGDAYRSVKWILGLYTQMLGGLGASFYELGATDLLSTALESVDLLRMNAETIAVPILLTASMAAALSNVLFSHLFNRNGGANLTALPRFEDWRCERWYVILIAAFSLTTILLRLFGVKSADALSSVADVLWRMPCALAGLCTVRKLGIRARKGWIFWIAVAMLLTLPPAALLILTVLGMLSSLRSFKRDGERME